MTTRDDTDQMLAAERSATDATVNDLTSQVAALEQKVKDLEAPPPAPAQQKLAYGFNYGGYVSTKGETQAGAFSRIKNGFGGCGVARWWYSGAPSADVWSKVPAYLANVPLCIELDGDSAAIASGAWDAGMRAFLQAAPTTYRNWWVFKHEQDNNKNTPAQYKPAIQRLLNLHKNNANRKNIRSICQMPMGVLFQKGDWRAYMADDLSGADCLGSDCYQHGKADPGESPTYVIGKQIAGAKEYSLPLVIGELGARRVTPQYSPGITDKARANFLNGCIQLFDTEKLSDGRLATEAVMYFEADRGSVDMVPWATLPYTDGTGVKSPLAAAAWKTVVSR